MARKERPVFILVLWKRLNTEMPQKKAETPQKKTPYRTSDLLTFQPIITISDLRQLFVFVLFEGL